MNWLQAVVLGIVQGLTEFLPVSSSGHLQLAKAMLGVRLEENLAFDVVLHAATVLSTIVVLWPEVSRIARGFFRFRYNAETAYVLKIFVSMIPIGVVGFLLKDDLDRLLASPAILGVVGAMLLLTALLLVFADRARPRHKETISYRDALWMGCAQAAAAMPGLSRSGATISTGIILGNRKVIVAQFSFLMVLLPILGETLLELVKGELGSAPGVSATVLAAGFLSSFIVGCLACRFMITIVRRGRLVGFAIYCAVAGIAALGYFLFD